MRGSRDCAEFVTYLDLFARGVSSDCPPPIRIVKQIAAALSKSHTYSLVMAPNLKLNAVVFISPQNHPILIRTFSKQDGHAIKYHYIAHTSLDVIEERGQHHALPPTSTKPEEPVTTQ
jgi:hypothetical protein